MTCAFALVAQASAQDGWAETIFRTKDAGFRASSATRKQAAGPQENDALSDLLGYFGYVLGGVKQSICVNSTLFHVEDFPDGPSFKKSNIAQWAKSTVRIRIGKAPYAQALMEPLRAKLGASEFSLGGFNWLAGDNRGICTGTLLAGTVVLTAGHCLAEKHWADRSVEFPYFLVKGAKRPLASAEFAKLLVVDFNYQLSLDAVAAIDDLFPLPARPPLPFAVQQLLAISSPNAQSSLDFAVLRLKANRAQVAEFALGTSKLRYGKVRHGEAVAVIQHPGGFYKQVSTGAVAAADGLTVDHNASTSEGSSGAAIITGKGEVIGIHTDGGCHNDSPNSGVPLVRIRRYLDPLLGITNK